MKKKYCKNCESFDKELRKDCIISFKRTSCPIYYTPPLNAFGDCQFYKKIWWKFWVK